MFLSRPTCESKGNISMHSYDLNKAIMCDIVYQYNSVELQFV